MHVVVAKCEPQQSKEVGPVGSCTFTGLPEIAGNKVITRNKRSERDRKAEEEDASGADVDCTGLGRTCL